MAKSKYCEDFPLLVEGLARDGLNDEQIAKKLGISKDCFYRYCKQHQDFYDALKRGKAPIDTEVENALLKRALGYSYDEITYENGNEVKRVKKHVLPDTTAQIFWLKNRKPVQWRDKSNVDLNVSESKVEQLLKKMSE